eukprot:TRINITY_DN10865_c0_g2_i1.p1 TRINITY_DN10865_c0_g2~~TRINITY_DN10865_c0_g2_i1.p1  ORF type:complete len:572 (+),score=132.18 TRINITY_DN10865_c0_g2_i1:166-1716(+)
MSSGPGEFSRFAIRGASERADYENSLLQSVTTAMLVLFVLSIPLVGLCYLLLKPFERRIREENFRTMKMLLMIPADVVDSVPAIREYLDTGKQEHAQQKLRDAYEESVARNESILNASIDAIVGVNANGIIETCNPATARMFHYGSPDELIGQNVKILMPPTIAAHHDHYMNMYLAKGDSGTIGRERELQGARKDGTVFPIRLVLSVSHINNKTIFAAFIRDISDQKEQEKLFRREKEKTDKLLKNLRPRSIAQQLREDGVDGAHRRLVAEGYKEVTVLFADIVGFTDVAGSITPVELVFMLNSLFSAWDDLTEKHGLEKIKTIGDCYMAAAGLPERCVDHARRVLEFGIDMIRVLQEHNADYGRLLNVRIGINVGPVVAGVLGKKKITYDLWGDAVNIASRMESSGVPGRIQVSHAAYEALKGEYIFEERGRLDIKGKGQMLAYLFKSRKIEHSQSGHVIRHTALTPSFGVRPDRRTSVSHEGSGEPGDDDTVGQFLNEQESAAVKAQASLGPGS